MLYSLDEATAKNEKMLEKEGKQAWNQREYKTLLYAGAFVHIINMELRNYILTKDIACDIL